MLRYGAKCKFSPEWADDALTVAAESGDLIALSVFSFEFDINHRIDGNKTPIMISAINGHFDAVKQLIDYGANTKLVDRNGSSAADLASNAGHAAISSLIGLRESEEWGSVQHTENLIVTLRRETNCDSVKEIDNLLDTKTFAPLKTLRISIPLESNELAWFRATDNCNIGLDESSAIIWMIGGSRVNHE